MTTILTVATHTFYPRFQRRLLNSLRDTGYSGRIKSWTGRRPVNCPPHNEVPYGFKLWALREAKQEDNLLLWLDSGLYAIKPIDPIIDCIKRDGYYLVRSEERLVKWCDAGVLAHYGVGEDEAKQAYLPSGAIIGLDVSNPIGAMIFDTLWDACKRGFYKNTVSVHSGAEGHRGDEAILGVIAQKHGLKLHTTGDHFGSDQEPRPTTVLRSGYYSKLETIAEHTIQTPELGPVLEIGCRNFDFAKAMAARGHTVHVFDPGRGIVPPKSDKIKFYSAALVPHDFKGVKTYVDHGNGTGNFLRAFQGSDPSPCTTYDVDCVSIERVLTLTNVNHFGIIKMDCEGAEYDILANWPGPIADQVAVEFHQHCAPQGPEKYAEIMDRMKWWYTLAQHELSVRHCLSTPNYWDSVWLLNGS